MNDVISLLALPFSTLAALGCGYVGYRLAFTGRNGAHGAVDVVFLSLCFAAIAKAVMYPFPGGWLILGSLLSVVVVAAAACIWRVAAADLVFGRLRAWGVSDHDGARSAWASMLARRLRSPMRLVVKLTHGGSLMCNDLRPVSQAPRGPCLFGEDGSVALYVTDMMSANDNSWTECRPCDHERPGWGYEMSFIPASQIARVDITRPA